jgi:adenylate cyclase
VGISDHRLAAVVFVDVVGFSRMMADDEEGTLAALRAHRNVTDPVVLNHGGRIVKGTGDGMILEFPSATPALRAAIEVQELMRSRNEELPESRRMHFRVGVNLAEIVVDETGDIFGDGVNVAARVESLADAGGIAITDAVREAVRGKLDVALTDDGEHELKNVPHRVRIWKVGASASAPQSVIPATRTVATIAVLPFENMSADADQEYFADGITEDLLTALSYDKSVAVVARNSTFAYKGAAVNIRTIARELDATHVVEGSVRRAGDRVRVTAQLIDAETGHHVWAERYDRELDDIFDLQDDLVDMIAAKLRPSLWESVGKRRSGRDVKSTDAWDLYLRGQHELNKHSIDGFLRSLELFGPARELGPDFVAPVVASASAWLLLALNGWRQDDIDPWTRGIAAANEAYRLDSEDYGALAAMAAVSTVTGEPDKGLLYARRAIEINPQGFSGYHMLGANLNAAGEPMEALESLTQAWRLGRHEPFRYDIANDLLWSHYMTGNYDAALSWGQRAVQLNSIYLQAHLGLAATYAQLGKIAAGQPHVAKILESRPNFSVAKYRTRILYRGKEHKDHIAAGLLSSGLPE